MWLWLWVALFPLASATRPRLSHVVRPRPRPQPLASTAQDVALFEENVREHKSPHSAGGGHKAAATESSKIRKHAKVSVAGPAHVMLQEQTHRAPTEKTNLHGKQKGRLHAASLLQKEEELAAGSMSISREEPSIVDDVADNEASAKKESGSEKAKAVAEGDAEAGTQPSAVIAPGRFTLQQQIFGFWVLVTCSVSWYIFKESGRIGSPVFGRLSLRFVVLLGPCGGLLAYFYPLDNEEEEDWLGSNASRASSEKESSGPKEVRLKSLKNPKTKERGSSVASVHSASLYGDLVINGLADREAQLVTNLAIKVEYEEKVQLHLLKQDRERRQKAISACAARYWEPEAIEQLRDTLKEEVNFNNERLSKAKGDNIQMDTHIGSHLAKLLVEEQWQMPPATITQMPTTDETKSRTAEEAAAGSPR